MLQDDTRFLQYQISGNISKALYLVEDLRF